MTQFKVDFNDFKRRDNTNLMEITLYKDNGEKITPNPDHQWSGKALKFGDGDKRLGQELAVTLDGDKIGVPSKQLEALPSGDYGLELWEVNNDSKTIYPSAGFIEFHIHRNADESLESVTPTTDINKVIDDLHQAGLNVVVDDIEMLAPDATPSVTSEVRDGKNHIKLHIPRGLKGDIGPAPALKIGTVTKLNPDQTPTANLSGGNGSYTLDMGIPQGAQGKTGTVDNAGLTTAPAFVELQTQVNNSAVGTNLLLGTRDSFSMTGTNIVNQWKQMYALSERLEAGTTVTISFDALSTALTNFTILNNGLNGGRWQSYVTDGTVDTTKKHFIATTTLASFADLGVNLKLNNVPATTTVTVSNMKLELGSHATPWSPNPSEILTQADYAKIKAAIVALGGSLS